MAHPVTPIAPTMPVAFCAGVSTCPNGATCADAWRSVSVTATVCGELLAPLAVTVIVGVASSIRANTLCPGASRSHNGRYVNLQAAGELRTL